MRGISCGAYRAGHVARGTDSRVMERHSVKVAGSRWELCQFGPLSKSIGKAMFSSGYFKADDDGDDLKVSPGYDMSRLYMALKFVAFEEKPDSETERETSVGMAVG